ncbi:hypothetical protein F4778DRAFT_450387 [Xylariomycetidae sp. FL2044]|nr:hypothetical protein F4778DRAFT_450387 [Xylariomycetidae sp. FL2044]
MANITPFKRRDASLTHQGWQFAKGYLWGKPQPATNGDHADGGDQPTRAAKRRRIEDDPKSAPRGAVGHLLSETPDDFEKALRVEVLQLTRKGPAIDDNSLLNGAPSPLKRDHAAIKARCRLIICTYSNPKNGRTLYCDSQICDFKVIRDRSDACPKARIYLPNPFHIPAEKIYVERHDEPVYHLADQYLIVVDLESAGDPNWPPVNLLPKDKARGPFSTPPRQWSITWSDVYKHGTGRLSEKRAKLRTSVGEELELDLSLHVDLRWSTSHAAGSTARPSVDLSPPDPKPPHVNGALEPLTNGHVNGRVDHLTNGYSKHDQDTRLEEDEEHDDATTPSRSLRTRDQRQNYNLKALSDKARGKERKERKKRKLANLSEDGVQVTWITPRTGELPMKNLSCLRCFATHSSLRDLIDHVQVHVEYKFRFDELASRITILELDQDTPRKTKIRHQEDFSSPESEETDSAEDISPEKLQRNLSRAKPVQPYVPAEPRDRRQLIPYNNQPMYDRLSKSLLEPGSLVDQPEIDDTWLMQKHRDIIRDYTDVHQDEKEYISEWDAFVNKECVTSEPHLQGVYLRFIQSKASWLGASSSRMTEWSKHLAYLKARNALTDETVADALDIMRQAKSGRRNEQPEVSIQTSPRTEYRKSASGCAVCGQPVCGPSMVICANIDCKRPLFHKECARTITKTSVNSPNWQCTKC